MSSQEDAELRLLQRARAGERAALEELLLNHYARLEARIAKKIPAELRGHVGAEDVLQETFANACRALATFEPAGPDAFYRWLATLAEHRLIDLVREARAEKRGGGRTPIEHGDASGDSLPDLLGLLAVSERTPSRSVAKREAAAAIRGALEHIEPDYRDALRLRYIEGLSVEDAAARLGRTAPALMMLCHRGLRRLREELGKSSDFFSRKE